MNPAVVAARALDHQRILLANSRKASAHPRAALFSAGGVAPGRLMGAWAEASWREAPARTSTGVQRLVRAVYRPVGLMLTATGAFTFRTLWSLLLAVSGLIKPRRTGLSGRGR